VRLKRQGDILIISVKERPAVASISISGNKDIATDPLLEGLKQIGLAESRVFDRSLLDKAEQELRRQYFNRGKYGVKIQTTVTPLERNRVAIAIDISEGRVAKIRAINIVGNKVFTDKELRKNFVLSTPTLFSFYTGNDKYSRQELAADLESLQTFYLDRGYINFNIDSKQVSITPDKKDIYITINVTEGTRYTIKEVKLAGKLVVDPQELAQLIITRPGQVFSRKDVTQSTDKISERLGNEGYAFANVNIVPDIDKENQQVTLTYFVDPGKRVYVRRINIKGNSRTQDEVLRREIRQMEGGWFSTEQVNLSRERLQRLGYFEDVNVETPAVAGTADQVDVDFTVGERASGNVLAGIGFSQTQGVIFNASVHQENFLGTGKSVGFAFNNSNVNTIYRVSYENPYYTLDGVSRAFNAFYQKTDAASANISDFTSDVFGGSITFGLPINDFNTVRLGAGYEHTQINTGSGTPSEIIDYLKANGNQFDSIKLQGGWSHDSRNRAIFPDRGAFQNVTAELGVPGGDLEYYKVDYRTLLFIALTRDLTLSLSGNVGVGNGYGSTTTLPFFEHFFAGGSRSVRGYEDNTLGPRDSNDNPFGGNVKLIGNAEIIFPVPFKADAKSIRLSAFYDVGNVYGDISNIDPAALRMSVGVAATWLSPFGALTFSLAYPFNDLPSDRTQIFQFNIGAGLY
jgi:outer membrane protein assembly complex, YaeT protein